MDIKQACDRFRDSENKGVAALVVQDAAIQRILAVWPMVRREEFPLITTDMDFDDLWSTIKFDEREAVELSGLNSGIGISAFRRAKNLKLIYPDGTLHRLAEMVLVKTIKNTLEGRPKR